jgi:histone deacetylase complex regulatory component SIN3
LFRNEDFKFKASNKNVFEENLFECEDGRFELDLLLSRSSMLKKSLAKLEEHIKTLPVDKRYRNIIDRY